MLQQLVRRGGLFGALDLYETEARQPTRTAPRRPAPSLAGKRPAVNMATMSRDDLRQYVRNMQYADQQTLAHVGAPQPANF